MYNLVKMDLYRLFRSASTYVMIALAVFVACFAIFMTNLGLNMMKDVPASDIDNADADTAISSFGIFVDTNPQWIDGDIDVSEMLGAQLKSRMALILVSVFVVLFFAAERKNGFIKNIAGMFHNRSIMVAAKFFAVAVQVFVLFAAYAAFTMISCLIFLGDRLVLSSVTELLSLLGVQYLLHFAFACFTVFLCLLSNSSALCIAIGILLCSGFGSLIYNLINYVIGRSFSVEKYMLETTISSVGAGVSSDIALRAVIVGVIFILASTSISMLIVQKRDIK